MRNSSKYMVFVLGMFMVCIGLFLLLFCYSIQLNVQIVYGITDIGPYIMDVAIISIALGFVSIAIGMIE